MQNILERNYIVETGKHEKESLFGEKIGFFASMFGCWHPRLSRPFTHGRESYRSCLHCGARQKFNAAELKTTKRFYYPPIVSQISDLR